MSEAREGRISRKQFIRTGAALGLGAAGVSIAAGCGTGEGSAIPPGAASAPGANSTAAGTEQTGPTVGKGQAIVKQSEVPANAAFPFTDADTGQPDLLIHLQNGEFVAYSAVCTHQGCTVAYQPQTQKIACPCHGSVFDPAKGAVAEVGPAKEPLPKVNVKVQNGEIIRV